MIYDKKTFSYELGVFLAEDGVDYLGISEWAYLTKLNNVNNIDAEVDAWLEELGAMSLGEDFELSLDELRNMIDLSSSGAG